jgi:hypothetical protein
VLEIGSLNLNRCSRRNFLLAGLANISQTLASDSFDSSAKLSRFFLSLSLDSSLTTETFVESVSLEIDVLLLRSLGKNFLQ